MTDQRTTADFNRPAHVERPFARDLLVGVGLGYTLATGRLFCDFRDFQRYASDLMGRSLMTHEFADAELWSEMRTWYEALVGELSTFDA